MPVAGQHQDGPAALRDSTLHCLGEIVITQWNVHGEDYRIVAARRDLLVQPL